MENNNNWKEIIATLESFQLIIYRLVVTFIEVVVVIEEEAKTNNEPESEDYFLATKRIGKVRMS